MARKKSAPSDDPWNEPFIKSLAPDAASIPAARKVLAKGVFRAVEPTADGRGWWCQCRGLTDTYQVVVRRKGKSFECECNCLSYKNPCKHALALLLYLLDHPELRAAPEQKDAAGDFESLLRAVFASSEDDAARLVFADFLDENGQADRAALIRYQCELARLRANSSRHKELTRLAGKLVPKLRMGAARGTRRGTGYVLARDVGGQSDHARRRGGRRAAERPARPREGPQAEPEVVRPPHGGGGLVPFAAPFAPP
jgi:uncharacterized protein (TIGR02996 family)